MFDKARRYLSKAPARIRDTAADMGTLVHACADALAKGEPLPPLPEGVSQAEVEAFVEQFERWREGYGIRFGLTEVEVQNPAEGYAGRFDSIAVMPDGENVLTGPEDGQGRVRHGGAPAGGLRARQHVDHAAAPVGSPSTSTATPSCTCAPTASASCAST